MGVLALAVVVWPGVRNLDLSEDAFPTQEEEVTISETRRAGSTTTETVTRRSNATWWDRAIGGGGVLLLVRIALAFAAAFIAGGVVQRALLGRFAFRAGGFELPEIAVDIDDLQTQVDAQQAMIEGQQRLIEQLVAEMDVDTARGDG